MTTMMIRDAETLGSSVTVRESDLLEVWIVALESGEWRQIRGQMRDETDGRCAYGVLLTLWDRMGASELERAAAWPALVPVVERAAAALGYGGIDVANDAGVTFAAIAQALRDAR